ncbi:hypothetical protein MARA_34620 [Mycolicibacterium arabiense]|uniref:Uncharacterized protein n=1 Tax=Mycolicibacterium arabiense TaxID=1286181 RepID=A0A7I7RZB7_9MYCO|nr:hypothetical protein MARA_34620 [Mycolicibacterium arabiense]
MVALAASPRRTFTFGVVAVSTSRAGATLHRVKLRNLPPMRRCLSDRACAVPHTTVPVPSRRDTCIRRTFEGNVLGVLAARFLKAEDG